MARLVGALSWTPKGCMFNPQSGHKPRLLVWSLMCIWEATNWSLSVCLCLSLCLSVSVSVSLSLSNQSTSLGEDVFKNLTLDSQTKNGPFGWMFDAVITIKSKIYGHMPASLLSQKCERVVASSGPGSCNPRHRWRQQRCAFQSMYPFNVFALNIAR